MPAAYGSRRTSGRSSQAASRAEPSQRASGRRSRAQVADDEEEEEEEQAEAEEEDDEAEEVEEDDDDEEEVSSSRRRGGKSGQTYGGRRKSQANGRKRRAVVEAEDDDDDDEMAVEVKFDDDEEGGSGAAKTQLFSKLTQAVVISDDEGDAEEDLEQERQKEKIAQWNLQMHANHPIESDTASTTINKLLKQEKELVVEVRSTLAQLADAVALLQETHNKAEDHPRVEMLDKDVRALIDAEFYATTRSSLLTMILRTIENGTEEGMDLVEKYKGTMEQMTEKLKAKTSRQKYADNDDYQQFKAYAWDAALWRNEGLPGIKDLIPREDGDEEDDDEMEIGAVTTSYKCPLTAAYLDKPVKSTVCKHYYSKDAITSHIQAQLRGMSRGAAQPVPCPVAGCSAQLTLKELQEDPFMARRVVWHQKKVARQEEERAKQRDHQAEIID